MRIFSLLLFFLLVYCYLSGQNLVPNPSFEDTISCPTTANQLDKCANWWPSRGSPDYFHECDFITQNTSVPYNFLGFQYAHTDNAYVGLVAYYRAAPNGREYITCQLLDTLKVGTKYKISLYVSLADDCYRIASNKLGVLFSTINYNLTSQAPILNYAQFYSQIIVTDTLNWIYLQGNFIADSSYSHLSIGNFFDDMNTDTIYNPPASFSYYYIDDVEVVEDTITHISDYLQTHNIKVYPTITNQTVYIISSDLNIKQMEIWNNTGKKENIFTFNNPVKSIEVDISNKKCGIYYVKIVTINSSVYHKIIKI